MVKAGILCPVGFVCGGLISALMQERSLTHSLCIGQQVAVFGLYQKKKGFGFKFWLCNVKHSEQTDEFKKKSFSLMEATFLQLAQIKS